MRIDFYIQRPKGTRKSFAITRHCHETKVHKNIKHPELTEINLKFHQTILSYDDALFKTKKLMGRLKSSEIPTQVAKTAVPHPKYCKYVSNAKRRTIVFELTPDEFKVVVELPCFYCGEEPGGGVDRYDNAKGYTVDNSVGCCSKCNYFKHNMSKSDFLTHVNKIHWFNKDGLFSLITA